MAVLVGGISMFRVVVGVAVVCAVEPVIDAVHHTNIQTSENIVGWDGEWLGEIRANFSRGGVDAVRKDLRPAVLQIEHRASQWLSQTPWTVTASEPPPDIDKHSPITKHDYYSISTYSWPCGAQCNHTRFKDCSVWWQSPHYRHLTNKTCDNATGLPWEIHDGYGQPLGGEDGHDVSTLGDAVATLAVAAYLLDNETFGIKAGEIVRTFFLAEDTQMNPNLDYAAYIPGVSNGSSSGIIVSTFRWNSKLTDSVILLRMMNADSVWSSQDDTNFKTWNTQFLGWLRTSKFGVSESNTKNNHFTWYTVYTASLAISLEDTTAAKEILNRLFEQNTVGALSNQIQPDGLMPWEARRSDGVTYSCMNMYALFTVGSVAKTQGLDVYNFHNASGFGQVRKALDFLLSYATNKTKVWPYSQATSTPPWTGLAPQLLQAARIYNDESYLTVLPKLPWATGDFESWKSDEAHLHFRS